MMLRHRAHWIGNANMMRISAALLVVTVAITAAYADKKPRKPSGAAKPDKTRVFATVNRDMLVWPNPPAIARIRWLDQLTGERIDPDALNPKANKKKQGWMDRLAGTQPDGAGNVKIPYQLIRPYGIAVDSKGRIYAADQGVDAIFIFNLETKAVEMIRNGIEAKFGLMDGLAIDDSDRLYVTDISRRQVLVFNANHQLEGTFGADVLVRPGGVAIDRENRFLYVVDTGNDQVIVFDADTHKVLRRLGVAGKKHTLTDPGTFSLPTSVALDKDGNVYVTDTLNNRVEIFDADGNFLTMFGKHGDGPGYFARPKGIAVDGDGHIWVVDTYQDRVQVFDREGRLLIYVGEHGGYPGQFQASFGIAIDDKNRVIVSEQFPGRLQVFRYVSNAEAEEARKKQANESGATAQTPAQSSEKAGGRAAVKTKDSAVH